MTRSWCRDHARLAFDETLAARIRVALTRRKNIEERKMFGGLCFLLNGNLLVGAWKDSLIARLGPDEGEAALREPHVRKFDITGKPMGNWVLVEPEGKEVNDPASPNMPFWFRYLRSALKAGPSDRSRAASGLLDRRFEAEHASISRRLLRLDSLQSG